MFHIVLPLTKILNVKADGPLLTYSSVYTKFLRKDIKFVGLLNHGWLLGLFIC